MRHFATRRGKNPWTPPLNSREKIKGPPLNFREKIKGLPPKLQGKNQVTPP